MNPIEADRRWWKASKGSVHEGVVNAAEFLADRLKDRHEHFLSMARMYWNVEIAGLGLHGYAKANRSDRLTLNVIASCVDTATAKIAKNKPCPQFLTSGADYKLRRKAEKLNKFGKGVLHQSGAYRIAAGIFRDACVFDTGIVKVFSEGKRVKCERVFPWELLVDDAEAMYGEPRQLIQRKYIDRAVLREVWGDTEAKRKAIEVADTQDQRKDQLGRDKLADQVEVLEAWHLPSAKGAKDGRHVIAIEGHTLLDEPWKRERFPFAKYTLEDPVAGFWGRGMASRLVGIQVEINRLLKRIERSMSLMGIPRVIIPSGAGVPKTHINNEIGAIISINGGMENAPTVITPQSVHPETFAHLDRLYARAFDEAGISQMSAHGEKPAGINSGAGLRELSDIESDRFVIASRRFEEFHIDIVRLALDEVREIPGFTVDVPSRAEKIELSWKEISLDDSAYVLQCFPASLLPQTPAGRLEKVQELYGAGFIDQDTAMELLDVPDLEEASNSRLASMRAIRARVDSMLDGGDYLPPEPFDNLQLITAYVPRLYLQERERGCPEDRLQALRDYTNEASALMAQAAAQAQATQASVSAITPAAAAVQAAPEFSPPMAA